MTDRNLFDTLYFNQVINNSAQVIDLTDDIEESDEEYVVTFPDSFSSSVGKILNEKNISAVLSNMEVFYKSQIEYLEDERYDKTIHLSDNSIIAAVNEELQLSTVNDKNELSKINEQKSLTLKKQSFSSYYFIKQTFNCPVVLIDHLINTMSDMKLDDQEIEIECPKQIEIDAAFETDKSNIITKRDLRLMTYYQPPKPKRSRSHIARPPKPKITVSNTCKKETNNNLTCPSIPSVEIIEISDSDEDGDLVREMESTYNEIHEVTGY